MKAPSPPARSLVKAANAGTAFAYCLDFARKSHAACSSNCAMMDLNVMSILLPFPDHISNIESF
jgi:hypothetical protein